MLDNSRNFNCLDEEHKRRYSTPQSRLSKILDRTIESGTFSLRRLINKSKEDHRADKLFSNENILKETRPVSTEWSSIEIANSEILDSDQTNNSIETPRDSQNFEQDLNSSFEEISNSTDENEQVLNSERNLSEKIDNYQTDTLSKTSMNSEEGYFSNHDSSASTLVLDPVVPNDESICTLKNYPLTISTPELLKQINLADNVNLMFDDINKLNSKEIMSMSLNEPFTYFKAKNFTDPVKSKKKFPNKCPHKSKNLTLNLNELSDENNSEMLSISMTSFSRIKNLCNIFEEKGLIDCRDISKSTNYLQENPTPRKKLLFKLFENEKDQKQSIENEIVRTNVKDLINKFEKSTNKSNF